MFYWRYKGLEIVLTDKEEQALAEKLCDSRIDAIFGYNWDKQTRQEVEKRIFIYLRTLFNSDFEKFNKEIYVKSAYGAEAQEVAYALLDAYGRVSKKAFPGKLNSENKTQNIATRAIGEINNLNEEDIFYITLFKVKIFPFRKYKANMEILIPKSSIQKVYGSVTNFFIATETCSIKFTSDSIRLFINK